MGNYGVYEYFCSGSVYKEPRVEHIYAYIIESFKLQIQFMYTSKQLLTLTHIQKINKEPKYYKISLN